MSKSIYEEAIKVVTYLQEQYLHLKDTTWTIYIPTEDIITLENLLIHSHKQEKLLKLYQRLYKDFDDLTLDEQLEIEKQIKELENER